MSGGSIVRPSAIAFLAGSLLLLSVAVIGPANDPEPDDAPLQSGVETRVPAASTLAFVENRGQVDPRVSYYLPGPDTSVFFTATGLSFALEGWAVKLDFIGADPKVRAAGEEQAGTVNYLTGSREDWLTGIPSYRTLTYTDLWPGIDLVYRTGSGSLKYDLVVEPGADPGAISMAYRGTESLTVGPDGSLRVVTPGGALVDGTPFAYQDGVHGRTPVQASYRLRGLDGVGFEVGPYDSTRRLVIDPEVLVYGTYLGGGQEDTVWGIAVDRSGSAYATGDTRSNSFPVTPGAFQTENAMGYDAFVTKFTPDGSGLVYSTFIAGEGLDQALDIAVDSAGNAYVSGETSSTDFPVTPGAFDQMGDPDGDAFVLKLNPDGSDLVFSTLLGGADFEDGTGIALDGSGAVYVAGDTWSDNFPVTVGAFDTDFNESDHADGFLAKIDSVGSSLIYATYLGGGETESIFELAADGSGHAYATGRTFSGSFPTTAGSFDQTFGGPEDAFVTKVGPTGSDLVFSTFLGGNASDRAFGIALDGNENVYVTGETDGGGFPLTPNAFDNDIGGIDEAFVTKFLASGAALDYSSFLGGAMGDRGVGIAVDRRGRATVAGSTSSEDFPVTPDAFQPVHQGEGDAFVTTVRAGGGGLLASTYLGGTDDELALAGVALDNRGNAYSGGVAFGDGFPTTPGAFDRQFDGDSKDGWVAKLDPTG
jgi:Beta-propeller repeat